MSGDVISLADQRPVSPEERIEAIAAIAAAGLGHGPDHARETLLALAVALSDLLPDAEELQS